MNYKLVAWVAIVAVVLAASAGAFWWISDQDGEDSPSWLFSHTSGSGISQDNGDGTVTVILTEIDPHVIGFTDRPDRDSAVIQVSDLVREWPAIFADSAPNAVLVEHYPNGREDSVVLTMSNPRLSEDSLTFDATVLLEEFPESLKSHAGTQYAQPPIQFEDASLFIDSVDPCFDPSRPDCIVYASTFIPFDSSF